MCVCVYASWTEQIQLLHILRSDDDDDEKESQLTLLCCLCSVATSDTLSTYDSKPRDW
jgi:hypothetical protein